MPLHLTSFIIIPLAMCTVVDHFLPLALVVTLEIRFGMGFLMVPNTIMLAVFSKTPHTLHWWGGGGVSLRPPPGEAPGTQPGNMGLRRVSGCN